MDFPEPAGMRIESASAADGPRLEEVRRLSVRRLAGGHYSGEERQAWIAYPLDALHAALSSGKGGVFVARRGERIAGLAWGTFGARPHLRSLYTHPGATGRGVGTCLLYAVEGYLRQLGARHLYVAATLNAEPFYLRRGFSTCHEFALSLPAAGSRSVEFRLRKMDKSLQP